MSWFRRWRRRWLESIAASHNSVAYELLAPIDED